MYCIYPVVETLRNISLRGKCIVEKWIGFGLGLGWVGLRLDWLKINEPLD